MCWIHNRVQGCRFVPEKHFRKHSATVPIGISILVIHQGLAADFSGPKSTTLELLIAMHVIGPPIVAMKGISSEEGGFGGSSTWSHGFINNTKHWVFTWHFTRVNQRANPRLENKKTYHIYMDVSKNNGKTPPNHPFVHRVFHEINHTFWVFFPLFLG